MTPEATRKFTMLNGKYKGKPLPSTWSRICSYIKACLKDKTEFVSLMTTFKKKFKLEDDFFEDLRKIVEKNGQFYVVQEYRKLKFYK